jgi:hypothetical protein
MWPIVGCIVSNYRMPFSTNKRFILDYEMNNIDSHFQKNDSIETDPVG